MSGTGQPRDHRVPLQDQAGSPEALISPAATAFYEALLRRGSGAVQPGDEAALRDLLSLGLVAQLADPQRWVPVPPMAALSQPLGDAVAAVAQAQGSLARAFEEAGRLQQLYVESRLARELSSHVAVLRGDAVAATVTAVIQDARTELLHLNTGHYRRPSTSGALVEPDKDAMAAGVLRVRCIYAESFLRLPDGERTIRQSQRLGEEIRVSGEVPMKLYLADDETAIVPLLLEADSAALMLRGTDLVHALRAFFELLWDRATPWPAAGGHRDEPLSPAQRRILELLAAGFSDDRIAETVGVTTRTVRRHVGVILERLGAPTRFAAAVAAHRRGWL